MYKVDIDIFNTRKVIIALIYDKEYPDYAVEKAKAEGEINHAVK